MAVEKRCKDCRSQGDCSKRPAPHPGPRCATHHREFKKVQKARSHERRVQKTYDLPPGHYDALLAFQGGLCAICWKARGLKRALAVDHDHETGQVRGALCQHCNFHLLGFYGPLQLQRALEYLNSPPYLQMIRSLP